MVKIISDGMVAVGFEGIVDFDFSPTADIDVEGAATAGAVAFEGSEGLSRKPPGVLRVVTVETMVLKWNQAYRRRMYALVRTWFWLVEIYTTRITYS